jgi:hypothetical protein
MAPKENSYHVLAKYGGGLTGGRVEAQGGLGRALLPV